MATSVAAQIRAMERGDALSIPLGARDNLETLLNRYSKSTGYKLKGEETEIEGKRYAAVLRMK